MNPQSVNYYYFLVLAGGTNENYNNDDPSMKKCLRKTRGELLLQEYEVGFQLPLYFTFPSTNMRFMLVRVCKWLYGWQRQPLCTVLTH